MADARTVREALSEYHRENGFKGDASTAETLQVRVLGHTADIPNPRFQRHLLARHDLHHVLTGYTTTLVGEAEIGAWELGAGAGHWFVLLNNVGALFLGVLAPRRTLAAFRRGRAARSLYNDDMEYEELLDMPLDALRARLGVPPP
jgi:ubiquinone biosynthesis protein Coq4